MNSEHIATQKLIKIDGLLSQDEKFFREGDKVVCLANSKSNPLGKSAGSGGISSIQTFLKRKPKLYKLLVDILAPVCTTNKYNSTLRRLLCEQSSSKVVINYGSGPCILMNRKDIINIDIFPFPAVDIVAGVNVPLRSNSVDLIISNAVLEHVVDPRLMVEEIHRLLKPGGKAFVYVPFMQPEHAAPSDFRRWTKNGGICLLGQLRLVESGVGAGPTSSMLWIMQHWLAMLISFGNKKIYSTAYIIIMILTFPLKYIDKVIPDAIIDETQIASGYYFVASKE